MTDRDKQEQTEPEVTYQTFSDFLQNTPPNRLVYIADLGVPKEVGVNLYYHGKINTPELELHCSHDLCNGVRFFRCISVSGKETDLDKDTVNHLYITYQCSNCARNIKVYSLAAKIDTFIEPQGTCYKFGELPPYGPPVSPKLIRLIQPEKDIFMQGRRCENQGLGIGAFTYYRRVVESQKNRILGRIVKVSEKSGVPQDKIDTLREAIKEIQFSKALRMTRDVIPESLLISGQNPILLLHHALSQGVHELTDEKCLELAGSIRVVLGELSERLATILKDEAELKNAVSTLMNYKNS